MGNLDLRRSRTGALRGHDAFPNASDETSLRELVITHAVHQSFITVLRAVCG
jgi:hypothetical protein